MSAPGVTCLQIDVGNSGAKWRLLVGGAPLERGRYAREDEASAAALLNCSASVDRIWVSSVASTEQDHALASLLRERWGVEPWFAQTPVRTGDLLNSYREPGRMGVDRWLAMVGARARCPARLCVVDVGSAMTIDLVAGTGRHEGGYILPGAALMERALQRDTQRVRFDQRSDLSLDPGRDTAAAVQHGIALALCGAVELVVQRASRDGDAPRLFLTGGGATMVADLLQCESTLADDLVFEGLSIMGESVV